MTDSSVFDKDNDDEDDVKEIQPIQWTNIMFLPFHPTWELIVLLVVVTKCTIGPISSIYMIHCLDTWQDHEILFIVKIFYCYFCDPIYAIDTFLFIVHRQVTDEAMKREYLPKPAVFILLDLIALVPFFHLTTGELCFPSQLYPNILAFTEILLAYRVFNYFSLMTTHSAWNLIMGYTINLILYVNAVACFLILLTIDGLCKNCNKGLYDWRYYLYSKMNASNDFITHIYCSVFVLQLTIHKLVEESNPSTYTEFVLSSVLMSFGYLIIIFIILPKLFAEGVLRIRRICTFHPRVKRIIEETKRRNPSPTAHLSVERFYSLIWTKRNGITSIPEIITDLPRYLKLNIRQDLYWPVFYHSPILRHTTVSYKRWMCDRICLDYKLPGERFFVGQNCYTKFYYIKSGIVQFISSEDSISATLSVTSGTIFGDISFFVPPFDRKVVVKCLTYCEVFSISRATILSSLHKFPEDRQKILGLAKDRIKHARTLHNCKNNIRGLDRADDEGLAWIKKRWWDINSTVKSWKKQKDQKFCNLSPEEANYHCVRYIGQVVLGENVELRRKSMFVKVDCPLILAPYSVFGDVWNRIVTVTVYLVLILRPPILASSVIDHNISDIFLYFSYFTDVIYVADVIVTLMTAVERNGTLETSLVVIMFQQFKNTFFILDLLSTAWIERFLLIASLEEYYYISQFNRLIKTYMLFFNKYKRTWKKDNDPVNHVMFNIGLTHFWFGYVLGYFIFMFIKLIPDRQIVFLYGDLCFEHANNRSFNKPCSTDIGVISIMTGWLFELLFPNNQPNSMFDIGVATVIITIFLLMHLYTKSRFIATLYLKYREIINYYYFVSNLKNHYIRHKIHPSLLKRLDRYLLCNWKYYNGMDVLHPNLLNEVPYDIQSKLHGELAEKIIGLSEVFRGANRGLIRELAHSAKFLILPKQSTLLAFGLHTKNVMWLAQGAVKCEYYNEEGEVESFLFSVGRMLTVSAVVIRKASLRTYTAETDVEILYLSLHDFYKIIGNYPTESYYFKTIQSEIVPMFMNAYQTYVRKHKTNQLNMRDKIFNSVSRTDKIVSSGKWSLFKTRIKQIFVDYRSRPESKLIKYWLGFRAVVVAISIISASLQGGSGAMIRPILMKLDLFCKVVTLFDIVIKLFLPYYDKRGIVISDVRMCVSHYMTRGFLLDLVGALPWDTFSNELTEDLMQNEKLLIKTFFSFAHIYLITGYFDYIADVPNVNISFLMIFKWQLVITILLVGVSHFFLNMCIDFTWNENYELVDMQRRNVCWKPDYVALDKKPTINQLHHLFAESLTMAQCGFLIINLGKFHVGEQTIEMSLVFLFLGIIFWYLMGYCQTLLILYYRGNTLFEHGVGQLQKFLTAERVEKEVIDRAVNHFIYVWIRTKGINVQTLMNKRIGAVFRQDLGYFFYRKTFHAVDTVLGGGESLERLLAGNTFQLHFLPGEEIMREMELSSVVFIIHRGKANVTKDGEKLATLSKGCIFGQLEGVHMRPVAITVTSIDHVDILNLTINQFQEIINDDVRRNIKSNPNSKNDFMILEKPCIENPFNTNEYILRDLKTIKLPWIPKAVSADRNNWYSYWLFCAWLIEPVTAAMLVFLIQALPKLITLPVVWVLLMLDIFHFVHLVSEFFTMEVVVVGNKCVKKYVRFKKLFCLDILSLLIPLLTYTTGVWDFQLARLLRIHSVYHFQRHFCSNFQTRAAPLLVKLLMVILLLHTLTCGWIIIACRAKKDGEFPVVIKYSPEFINTSLNTYIDSHEWVHPDLRKDAVPRGVALMLSGVTYTGCPRCTKLPEKNSKAPTAFVVPKDWQADYIVAFTYVIITQTHTNLDSVVPLTLTQIYYKVFMTFVLYLVEMWLGSICISAVYTKFREMYFYDFHVSNLIMYLRQNGLSQIFLQTVMKYTKLLWQRQRGNWLPDITQLAPACLKEDILSALYLHHLETVATFKVFPLYFLRQLAARLNRVVIFPGNMIVKEGDIFSCIYFIHEGEVEKWNTDSSGDSKLVSILEVNGYFGLIPGLFPDIPYKFSYVTRTVVDLVYLLHEDWQDLLNCYPDLKRELYIAADKLKNKYS